MIPKSRGAAAVSTPASPTTISGTLMAPPSSPEPLPRALGQEHEQHERSLEHPRQGGIKPQNDGQLDAPHVQGGEEQRDRCCQDSREVHEHRDHEPEVAVAAGDRRDEPVVHGCHLDRAGHPREHPAKTECNHHVLPGRDSQQVSRVCVAADRLEPQAERGAADKREDRGDREHREHQRRRAQPRLLRESLHPQRRGERQRAGHRCHARPLPGPENEPEVQSGGHEVEPETAEDLVDPAKGYEGHRRASPRGRRRPCARRCSAR